MKIPVITDHAEKLRQSSYYTAEWRCHYCQNTYTVYHDHYANLRAHMRRMHRREYTGPYVIEEEADTILLSVLLESLGR